MSAHPHRRTLAPVPDLGPEARRAPSDAEALMADWVLQAELGQTFALRGVAGLAVLLAASLALWIALVWAVVGVVA